MRQSMLAAAALSLSACGQTNTASVQDSACARSATHAVEWSQAGVEDVITTTSQGPTCAQAIVTFTVRNAGGDPLWVFAGTHHDLTAGGGYPPDGAPEIMPPQMDAFLASWADVSTSRSASLPEWREGVATLTESANTFAYDTPFDRDTYEMLRARDLPMICYAAAAEASQCLIIDPASHSPTMIVAYGP